MEEAKGKRNNLIKKRLSNIISIKYIQKINKYVVELAIVGEPKQTVWLTPRQMINLNNCFDETKNGFSNKHVSVCGYWNEKGYYAFTSVERHKQHNKFKMPYQYDLAELIEEDEDD